jgi:hypothetical protein
MQKGILGAFAKLRKGTVDHVMSVRMSAWKKFVSEWTDIKEISYLSYSLKTFRENSGFIKIRQE